MSRCGFRIEKCNILDGNCLVILVEKRQRLLLVDFYVIIVCPLALNHNLTLVHIFEIDTGPRIIILPSSVSKVLGSCRSGGSFQLLQEFADLIWFDSFGAILAIHIAFKLSIAHKITTSA